MDRRRKRKIGENSNISSSVILKELLKRSIKYIIFFLIILLAIFISKGIILVKEGEMAILIKKTGKDLTNRTEKGYRYLLNCPVIAPDSSYKGIQLEPLAEGWHFYNPYTWDYEIHKQIRIEKGEVGIKIRLFGEKLNYKEYQVIAQDGQKGIVEDVLKPGQYLINPYAYKIIKMPAVVISKGYRGVVVNYAGKISKRLLFCLGDIKDASILALRLKYRKKLPEEVYLNKKILEKSKDKLERDKLAEFLYSKLSEEGKKIIDNYNPDLIPHHKIRKRLMKELNNIISEGECIFTKERFEGIKLSQDVKTLLLKKDELDKEGLIKLNRLLLAEAYPFELEKYSFLVAEGERGVCAETVLPGTYYWNPFKKQAIAVDIRSHRFDLTGRNNVKFPSYDGFTITLEGNIEWRINPERVAEVLVKYKDERDIITCIVEKIIMPNARAFIRIEGSKYPAKDFISGKTREEFQNSFYKGLFIHCGREGIIINAARITKCTPPDAICNPIQQRELAIRNREKYKQEIEREKEEIALQQESARKDLEIRKTKAQTKVAVAITKALREKEVAIISIKKELEVAKKRLEAAKNQAQAILLTAKANADVIRMKNKAEASGLEEARVAFGTGKNYAYYILLQKISNSLKYILANTDSPFLKIFNIPDLYKKTFYEKEKASKKSKKVKK